MISGKLNPENIRGFIIFPDGGTHELVAFCQGKPLIVVARDLPEPWRRLVMIKELMHYFDEPLEKVSSGDEFEGLIAELGAPFPDRSPAVHSEHKALWMAFGVICTEEQRQEFQRQRVAGEITDEQIADRIGMPISIVAYLFEPNFKAIINSLFSDD